MIDFFSLHRQIFAQCPNPECGGIFRLSDTSVYLRRRPADDWMDELDREEARLARLEEKLEEREREIRERAREAGRQNAMRVVKKFDPVFTPRRLNPDDAKVVFHPIDYLVFKGMKGAGGFMRSILLLDRQGTSAAHRSTQRSIERVIERGHYEWQTLRVGDDGAITVDD
jgi:predicted Holliday junction resolvase-like endonuclease